MSKFDFLDRFNKPEPLSVDKVALEDFASQIGAEIIQTESGKYLHIKTDYPHDYLHGDRKVQSYLKSEKYFLENFEINQSDKYFKSNQLVFIDTETTGLSAASGTVAFLIGVGVVTEHGFTIHQFFLPDYEHEAAQLEAVSDLLDDKDCIVSFNGKSFDIPLMETRYIMQRQKTPFAEMYHLDLLHSSRRFWGGRFEDNTLQTLERELLGLYRHDDTPGYLIPQLYFNFLRTGDAEKMNGVLIHNRLDIISLLALCDTIQRYIESAERFEYYSVKDAMQIAKFYYRQRNLKNSLKAANAQYSGSTKDETEIKLGFHLCRLQKRFGKYEEALSTFTKLISCRGEDKLLALEGAAKINEHQLKEYQTAVKLTIQAREYLDSPLSQIPYHRVLFWNETLEKRYNRLLKKTIS